MKVEDIERAVKLKREMDEVSKRLTDLHELGRGGVSSFQAISSDGAGNRVWLEETVFGTDLMLDVVQLFIRHHEARYNQIAQEIASL